MARKQTAKIWYQNALHKEIYFDGHYHDAMYKGAELMWKKLPNTPTTEWYGLVRQVVNARGNTYALVDTYKVYPPTTTSQLYAGIAEYDESAGGWVIFMITDFLASIGYSLRVTDSHFILGYTSVNDVIYVLKDNVWTRLEEGVLDDDEYVQFSYRVYGKHYYYDYFQPDVEGSNGAGITRYGYSETVFPISKPIGWSKDAVVVSMRHMPNTTKVQMFGKGFVEEEKHGEMATTRYIIGGTFDLSKFDGYGGFIYVRCDAEDSIDCDFIGVTFNGSDTYVTIREEYFINSSIPNQFRLWFFKNGSEMLVNRDVNYFRFESMTGFASITNTGDYYLIYKTQPDSYLEYELWGGRTVINMDKLNIESNLLKGIAGMFEDSEYAKVCRTDHSHDIKKSSNEVTYNRMNFFKGD